MKKYIPNILSWSRIVTLPVIMWLIVCSTLSVSISNLVLNNFQIIAILLLVGFLTDIADGFLARLWKVESKFGNILDHVADRLMILPGIYLFLTHMRGWPLIVWLGFELAVVAVSGYLFFTGEVKAGIDNWPNWSGKLSYVTTAIAMMVMLTTIRSSIWQSMHLIVNLLLTVSILLRAVSLRTWFKNH